MTGADLVIPVLWPGDGFIGWSYLTATQHSKATGARFATFLASAAFTAAEVSFISHSLGARVVLETVSLIGGETLQNNAATSYADVFRAVPGLNVTQTSARDINLTSRGATSTLSTGQLALVDGRSIYLDFFGFVAWDFLPVNPAEIKQIEVIRGPASAIWGANAVEQPQHLWTLVAQLRRKIEPDASNPRYLVSEPWVGYRFATADAENGT